MLPSRLTEGYRSFLDGRFKTESNRYEQLSESGQHPEIMLIGCVDSRVSPEVIFDAGPGEMLVVRNVANLVPKYETDPRASHHGTSAAIEFGVNGLKVKHIVVLGHALCGGVRAFHDCGEPLSQGDFISKWMAQIEPAAKRVGPMTGDIKTHLKRLELAVVEESLNNLLTFPFVRRAVEAGELELHGAYFGVATGLLFLRDPATGEFRAWLEETEGQ
ncbi:carbonic anhydrase [Pusillimonas sp.]|uniref:carbonic anhydrase n=1 Tax=Pusillimonas sp. TaxID=3040095 RepID=UPI0037C54451